MKNYQNIKMGSLTLVSMMLFGGCALSSHTIAAEENKMKPLSKTIKILFGNDKHRCPIGAIGGSDETLALGAGVTFKGVYMNETELEDHPVYQIGFSPFEKPKESDKNGEIHYKVMPKLPLGNSASFRFTYTVYADKCNPVDPVIIIEL